VEIVVSGTIWLLFTCVLVFPLLRLPPLLERTALVLLAAELIATAAWSYGSAGCERRPCAAVAEMGRAAAVYDVPLLAVGLVLVTLAGGVRAARRDQPPG